MVGERDSVEMEIEAEAEARRSAAEEPPGSAATGAVAIASITEWSASTVRPWFVGGHWDWRGGRRKSRGGPESSGGKRRNSGRHEMSRDVLDI